MSELIRREVRPVEQVVERRIVCDLCGCDAEAQPDEDKGAQVFERWDGAPKFDDRGVGTCSYSVWEPVTIEYEQGISFPEGSQIEKMRLDLCPKCFRNRFLQWFVQEGGKIPEIKEYDY